MTSYIAVIHKDPESSFGVSFPDFPGCFSAADTLDEAKDAAKEALEGHIAFMQEDGEGLPTPSTLDHVMADELYRTGVAFLVDIAAQKEKAVRIQVTLLPSALAAIDVAAGEKKKTRSRYLVESALEAARA